MPANSRSSQYDNHSIAPAARENPIVAMLKPFGTITDAAAPFFEAAVAVAEPEAPDSESFPLLTEAAVIV